MNDELALPINLLIEKAAKLDVVLSEEQAKQLSQYAGLLIEYNKHTNLVGNADPERLLQDHFLDSLSLLPLINRLAIDELKAGKHSSVNLIDIGTGAGFPGLVLAIAKLDLFLTVVDATAKKTIFIESVVQSLKLSKRVKVVHSRAEGLAHKNTYRGTYNFATCRAVGTLPVISEITLPFLKTGGYALLQRGGKQMEEDMKLAKDIAVRWGAQFVDCIAVDQEVIGKDHRVLVFQQEKRIASKYPRSWSEIKR